MVDTLRHFDRKVAMRALTVAIVVGTILNLINRYDLLFGTTGLNTRMMFQMALTYLVPFLVSTHGQLLAAGSR